MITDGASGTELQARGLAIGECADAWNLTQPDLVFEVARLYASAGSRIVLTNTFSANAIALHRYGLTEKARAINLAGVEISRRAAGRAAVFGCIGPAGPAANAVKSADVHRAFAEQAEALADGGAAGIVIETMSDIHEAVIAVRAAKATRLPVVGCMAFGVRAGNADTLLRISPEQGASALADAGADAIGANCGLGPREMLAVCERLRSATPLPLWMKPNARLPRIVDGRAIYDLTPTEWAAGTLDLRDAGAHFIGGCCGAGPAYIRALSAVVA